MVGVIILVLVFLFIFLTGDEIKKECVKTCKENDLVYSNHQVSPSYNFVKCFCNSEEGSVSYYFDLETFETLSSNQILQRIMG